MSTRATAFGAALGLVLLGTGTCRALSLRGSSAEASLGEATPGTVVVLSQAAGSRLKVENTGKEAVRVEFKAATPALESCKDGFEPWPYAGLARVETIRGAVKAGEAAEADLAVSVPKGFDPKDGQYQLDVLATGRDAAGLTLTVKTRILIKVAARADAPAAGVEKERAGFVLTPDSAFGSEAVVKLVNADEEDLTVSISADGGWSGDARIPEGYEPAPNPRWLRFDPSALKIGAGAIGRARIWTSVPREKRYAGRRFSFASAVDAVAGGRRTRRYFVLNVETKGQEEDQRVR